MVGLAKRSSSNSRYGLVFLFMVFPELLGKIDVGLLPPLASPGNQVDHVALLSKVDAVPWTKVDYQFRDSLAHRLNVSEVSVFETVDSLHHDSLRLFIKPIKPFAERLFVVLVPTNQYLSWDCFQLDTAPTQCDVYTTRKHSTVLQGPSR